MHSEINMLPEVIIRDSKCVATSLNVASVFGKSHRHVLRDIENLMPNCPETFTEPNFGLSEYEDSTGRKLPLYLLTRDGLTLLIMGYTGRKAMQFKLAYMEAFNAMEKELESRRGIHLDFGDPAAAARAWADEYEAKLLAQKTAAAAIEERNHAVRTKAWIGGRREATAMATASAAVRQRDKALDELGEGRTWKQVKAIGWLKDVFNLTGAAYSQIGKKLVRLSSDMGLEVKESPSREYGTVKRYHVSVIDRFHAMLMADPMMMGKYRLAS